MWWAIAIGIAVGALAGSGGLKTGIEWVVEQIEWLIAEVRYWKHEFFKMLAEWLEYDFAWMLLVAATVALSFSWKAISSWFNSLKLVLVIKEAIESIKEGSVRLIEAIHLIDIYTVHEMLKVAWPQYRKLIGQFSDAVSALAEELGQGSGYIHAYFGVIYGIAQVEAAYLNLPGEAAQLAAFEETDTFLRKIDDRFQEYSHDPGKIVRDIIEEIYVPHANTVRDGQQAVISDIETNYEYIVNGQNALVALEGRLTHFIAIQPEEMAEIIEERLGPIRDALADFNTYVNEHILIPISGAIDALNYRARILEQASINAADRLKDPFTILSAYFYYPEPMQEAFESLVYELSSTGADLEIGGAAPGLDYVTEALIGATADYLQESLPVEQPRRPALDFELPGVPAEGAIPSWFQGEY